MKKTRNVYKILTGILLTLVLLSSRTQVVFGAYTTPVVLGDASSFAVLAGSTITNTGTTTITGTAGNNIGVSPGTAITESTLIVMTGGTKYSGTDALVVSAKTALTNAIGDIQGRASTTIPAQLASATLVAGVYSSATGFDLAGTLTLDAQGDPNAVFIFKTGDSTLTTASSSNMILLNGADACRVFWQVGSSATLGTNSTLYGHVLATASITATTGARVIGSLLASSGAVTLDTNTIVNDACGAAATLVVVKNVVNDNNGTNIASDFSINVTSANFAVSGSPANGSNVGVSYTLTPGVYVISEPAHAGYDMSFSGDIDSNGTVTLVAGETRTITITNNDITPTPTETLPVETTPTTEASPLPTTFSDQGFLILLGGATALIGALGWYVKRKQ